MKKIQLVARLKHRGFVVNKRDMGTVHWINYITGTKVLVCSDHITFFFNSDNGAMFYFDTEEGMEELRKYLDNIPTTYAIAKIHAAEKPKNKHTYDPATRPPQRCRNPKAPMDGQVSLTDKPRVVSVSAERLSEIVKEELDIAWASIMKRLYYEGGDD